MYLLWQNFILFLSNTSHYFLEILQAKKVIIRKMFWKTTKTMMLQIISTI